MNALTIIKTLGPIDGRNTRRDPMLRWMLFAPLFLALIFRFVLPWAVQMAAADFGVDLRPYLPMLYAYLALIIPVLYGAVVGFLLLDERDDRTLLALQVTPLPLAGYAAYRIGVPIALSLLLTPLTFWVVGMPGLSLWGMWVTAVAAAPLAPIYMLLLAAFAANKVQGFALMKGLGIFLIVPLVAWFLPMPWQLVLGLLPTYWPVKVFWLLLAGENYWGFLAVGLLYQSLVVVMLYRRFQKVMSR
ncbi:MAG TPA: hypothetical protein PLD25_21920 [Chloroflexota bacterium]|nr:hypothetical protein [Chloroflexota bacterium]